MYLGSTTTHYQHLGTSLLQASWKIHLQMQKHLRKCCFSQPNLGNYKGTFPLVPRWDGKCNRTGKLRSPARLVGMQRVHGLDFGAETVPVPSTTWASSPEPRRWEGGVLWTLPPWHSPPRLSGSVCPRTPSPGRERRVCVLLDFCGKYHTNELGVESI